MALFLCYFHFIVLFIGISLRSAEALENSTEYLLPSNYTNDDQSEAADLLGRNLTSSILAENVEDIDDINSAEMYENSTWSALNRTDTEMEELYNVTALPEVMDGGSGGPAVGTSGSAIILAGTFLIIAAVAYGGMLTWRRYLQVRYSNSEMLITDDAYDISDLRNFEI